MNNTTTGHYVVIYKVVPDGPQSGVWFLDTIDGKEVRFRQEAMPKFWSGYVLMPKQPLAMTDYSQLAASTAFWMLVVVGALFRVRRHSKMELRACVGCVNANCIFNETR